MCQRITPALSDAEYAELLIRHQAYIRWLWKKWDQQATYGAYRQNPDDLIQEVNLHLWRRRALYDPARVVQFSGPPFLPWVKWSFRAVINGMRDRQTRRAGLATFVTLSKATRTPDRSPSPRVEAERKEAHLLVRRAVVRLPRRQRNRLIRHVFKGETFASIGAREGCTKQAIENGVGRSMAQMKPELVGVGP